MPARTGRIVRAGKNEPAPYNSCPKSRTVRAKSLSLQPFKPHTMAGIYLHIPFCKTRCVYCDFCSTTRLELKQRYVRALCRELEERSSYLGGEPVRTVYLGGGTPSLLDEDDFRRLFRTLDTVYGLQQAEEITLEANPDDLNDNYTSMLASLPFNRISIGIQTFDPPTLRLLNRRHSARQAIEAVERCRRAGFGNISIDLIYGLPGETDSRWQQDLQQALALDVEHISAYHLTYEEGTRLYRMLQDRRVSEVDEDSSLRFFGTLMDTLAAAGYVHYEISNFCKPGRHSRHNTAYWQGIPYLGCGPSAHSFDTRSRQWNDASPLRYIQGMEQGQRPFQTEQLDDITRYNEFVMTRLRTRRGIPLPELERLFGPRLYHYCLHNAAPHLAARQLQNCDGHLCLTRQGIFVSDGIISDLFFDSDEA